MVAPTMRTKMAVSSSLSFSWVPAQAKNALEYVYPNDEASCAPLFQVSSTNIRLDREGSSRYIAILLSHTFYN